jgi:hypothetical protein
MDSSYPKSLSLNLNTQSTHVERDQLIHKFFFAMCSRIWSRQLSAKLFSTHHQPHKKVVRVADASKCSTFRVTGSRSTLKSQAWFDRRRGGYDPKGVSLAHLETSETSKQEATTLHKKKISRPSTHNQPTCLETRQTSHRVEPFRNFFSGSEFFLKC